jgi:hypothetical protein
MNETTLVVCRPLIGVSTTPLSDGEGDAVSDHAGVGGLNDGDSVLTRNEVGGSCGLLLLTSTVSTVSINLFNYIHIV